MNKSRVFFVLLLVLAALFGLGYDYMTLPAYNPGSFGFWVLIGIALAVLLSLAALILGNRKGFFLGIGVGALPIVAAFVLSIGSWLILPGNDAKYAALLPVTERDTAAFLSDFSDSTAATGDRLFLPTIDKELSVKTAQGKLGQYGAQFSMNEQIFTAVSVWRNGSRAIVRVSPLDYSGLLVALSLRSDGTAGYLEVDQSTGEGRLVEVPGGMKYTPGAILSYDLMRRVRFKYRSALLGAFSFEIDDSDKPWWIIPEIKRTIGMFGGSDSAGIIMVDPVSGEVSRYAAGQEPEWVDRVVPTAIIMDQAYDALSLAGGWVNRMFGQKRGVFQLSDGYNYEFSDSAGSGSTWFVSGVTSPNEADQTLAGFMMVNTKTKEARRYSVSGVTEMRAMEIAESDERVKAQVLAATWPILTEVGGEPAYFMFLKNQVQRQRFVYLDAATGQRVAMGDTIEKAKADFARLSGSKIQAGEPTATVAGVVFRVRANSQDGTTSFILAGEAGTLYSVDSALSNGIRFMEPGDSVEVSYRESSATPGRRFVTALRNTSLGE